IAAVAGVQVMMRTYQEEVEYRVEPILATAVTRPRWFGYQAGAAFGIPVIVFGLGSALVAVAGNLSGGDVNTGELLRQAAAGLPAIALLIAVAVAVIGARPVVRPVAWLGIVASFALTILGPSLNLWDWVLAIGPFHHV